MAKIEYQLKIKNLAAIGILEDFFDIYCFLQSQSKLLEVKNKSNNTINKQLKEIFKEKFNELLKKHTYVFSDRYEPLYINCSLKDLNFYSIALRDKSTSYIYSFKNFPEFLKECQYLIVKAILKTKRQIDKNVSFEEVWEDFNSHIFDVAYQCVKNNKKTTESPLSISTLIVYKSLSSISCNLNNHTIKPTRLEVPLINKGQYVILPIHVCETCNKRFVGNQTIRAYEKIFGKMIFDGYNDSHSNRKLITFSNESKLHRLGYNVIEGKLLEKERREILEYLINNHIMTDFEIRKDIENAISIFDGNPKYDNAVYKWQSDLVYLTDLQNS